jgi:hypothetical protein
MPTAYSALAGGERPRRCDPAAVLASDSEVEAIPGRRGDAGWIHLPQYGYEIAVHVDGDGQHDPGYIPELFTHLQKHPDLSMVTGSRP